MAKSKKKSGIRNAAAVAMFKRYGSTTTTHKDRRTKRRNRQSWRKDEGSAWE